LILDEWKIFLGEVHMKELDASPGKNVWSGTGYNQK